MNSPETISTDLLSHVTGGKTGTYRQTPSNPIKGPKPIGIDERLYDANKFLERLITGKK